MRHQGRITTWKDDQGYGFVTPSSGGREVFVHISSFSNRDRRPVGNETVTYKLKTDSRGRLQGESVEFIGDTFRKPVPRRASNGSVAFAISFLAFVAGLALMGELPLIVPGLYLGISVLAFIAYAADKSSARSDARRTPENTLHVIALLGGWPGALLAQKVFRHKSKKRSFQVVFWITVILNCMALGWLFATDHRFSLDSILQFVRVLTTL